MWWTELAKQLLLNVKYSISYRIVSKRDIGRNFFIPPPFNFHGDLERLKKFNKKRQSLTT